MSANNNKKLFIMLAKVLNVKSSKVNIKTSSKNLNEWDSLGSLNIMSFLEKKFKNKIKKFDVKETDSVKKIIKLLGKNKVKI
jgi:acyl carrier protein|tara:strand:+ start:246 stop:491 length:246 start_codon:yes stop_codon:yes gene_type:complete